MSEKNEAFSLFILKKTVLDGHFAVVVLLLMLKRKYSPKVRKLFEEIQFLFSKHKTLDLKTLKLLENTSVVHFDSVSQNTHLL